MGYMRHHAILVSSWDEKHIEKAHDEAVSLFGTLVSDVLVGVVNNERTFVVAPDGSKEGWPPSEEHDAKRDTFIAWLRAQAYEDGSNRLRWAEVQYGDDEWESKVTRSGDDDQKAFRLTPAGIEQYGPVSVHHSSPSQES